MTLTIRSGTADDLEACLPILQMKRTRYQTYEPQFWKLSPVAGPMTQAFLGHLIAQPTTLFLVAEENGAISGFLTAKPQPAPPVFAPGETVFVDDFYVADDAAWPTTGAALLREARAQLKERGCEQVVVVTAYRDDGKMAMLKQEELSLASAWWVGRP
jgi:GNAT superfamily N-acetyltransferase